jgi:hypothetical protein
VLRLRNQTDVIVALTVRELPLPLAKLALTIAEGAPAVANAAPTLVSRPRALSRGSHTVASRSPLADEVPPSFPFRKMQTIPLVLRQLPLDRHRQTRVFQEH